MNKLNTIDANTLADLRIPPNRFCIKTLLPQGLTILGGAPKIGKSWLILDICLRVSKGEAIWNLPTTQGTTLYLCLEDTLRRVQDRLFCVSDEMPDNTYFSICANTLGSGLCEQISQFVQEHPDTVLVVIDTFQMIRDSKTDTTYGSDYQEIVQLKRTADDLGITILLVHHLRKQGDNDPLNKLSGSTGISGAVDSVFVLDKSKRNQSEATLICTGRDIEYREFELKFMTDTCTWELISDSAGKSDYLLPQEMVALLDFMRKEIRYFGGNTELVQRVMNQSAISVSSKGFKQMMNRWRYELEEQGLFYRSSKSNGQRYVQISYIAPKSSGSDASDAADGI